MKLVCAGATVLARISSIGLLASNSKYIQDILAKTKHPVSESNHARYYRKDHTTLLCRNQARYYRKDHTTLLCRNQARAKHKFNVRNKQNRTVVSS